MPLSHRRRNNDMSTTRIYILLVNYLFTKQILDSGFNLHKLAYFLC